MRLGGTSVGMMALVNTVVNSAAMVATTNASTINHSVGPVVPGAAIHSATMPPARKSENSAIHGLRRPRPSASAPSSGLPMAIRMPAAAAP